MTWIKPPESFLDFLKRENWSVKILKRDFLLMERNLSTFIKNIVIDSLMGLIQ